MLYLQAAGITPYIACEAEAYKYTNHQATTGDMKLCFPSDEQFRSLLQNLNAAINGTEVAEVQNTVGVLKAAFVMIMLIPCRARLDNWQKAMG